MTSQAQIFNEALQNIGAKTVSDPEENTPQALECRLRYSTARKIVLSMHHWNFAIKRAKLNLTTDAPLFNYAYQYQLPVDFITLVMTDLEELASGGITVGSFSPSAYYNNNAGINEIDRYKIEGNKLISNRQLVGIIYVGDEEDESLFSPIFAHLLARLLGALCAYKLVGSKEEREAQIEIFKDEFLEFQAIDGQQGTMDVTRVSQYLSAGL